MSKYIKAVDLWDNTIINQIAAGALKLQSGQWVLCGGEKPSRLDYITVRQGEVSYIRAFHPPHATRGYLACHAKGRA